MEVKTEEAWSNHQCEKEKEYKILFIEPAGLGPLRGPKY
jgi:hypothetical protein